MTEEEGRTYQATESYDSDILGSGSGAIFLEWAEDSYTATQHRCSHGGRNPLRDLQQNTVCQKTYTGSLSLP